MKIAFYLTGYRMTRGNGVVSQAHTWKKGLEQLGHSVVLCNQWDYNNLQDFDAVQIFGFNESTADMSLAFSRVNPNLYVAPILDPDYSIAKAWLMARYGSFRLRISSRYSSLHDSRKRIKGVLVRSEFEKSYMTKAFGFTDSQCHIVSLPSGVTPEFPLSAKENFCLNICLLTDQRKNVRRLIEAAKKYNFRLILAGGIRSESERNMINEWIGDAPNIECKGWISEEEKADLYRRAKVFALPSINEGVGIVALEAASYGADVVITSLGGPKEYYSNLAEVVDPYSVDDIGQAVTKLLGEATYQPQLAQHIHRNFSLETISQKLANIYAGNAQ